MAFSSLIYLFFLLLTATGYYLVKGRYRWIWLLAASVGYYLSFIPVFLPLLVVIIAVNYFLARGLARSDGGRSLRLGFIITINIIILVFFKYFNTFFPDFRINLYVVDLFFRAEPINKMVLPLGLSYLIFTLLSYHIELKRNNIQHDKHPGYFALYLTFFPRIAQGPIERPQALLPQLRKVQPWDVEMIADGVKRILWGYFKKLVVADRLAIYVNAVYGNHEYHNGTTLILATIFFAFQIYADFSGYTDIALGSASIFGIKLTDNFRRPYFATSVKEFWNRWHITFSTWLRDYLFLPLAFFLSKRMKKPSYLLISTEKWIYLIAIMVTFMVCGIWHGEGWNFLVWGMLFGLYLTYSNWTEKFHRDIRKRLNIRKNSSLYLFGKPLLIFTLVLFAWIFFRANTMQDALQIVRSVFTTAGTPFFESPGNFVYAFFGILVLLLVDVKHEYFPDRFPLLHHPALAIRFGSMLLLIFGILLLGVFDGGQFIYFQF